MEAAVSRTPARITQADVARAIRAAKQAGATAVEVAPDGTIRILLVKDTSVHSGELVPEPPKKVIL
jgi:hypothetical protein